MQDKIKMCHGTHGGYEHMCDTCEYNIELIDDENNEWKPEEYEWLDELVCRLNKPYWSQYKTMHVDT